MGIQEDLTKLAVKANRLFESLGNHVAMLGRLIVSSTPEPPGTVNIMGVPGLHLSWAAEAAARVILKEYSIPDADFRIVAYDSQTAKQILARSGFLARTPVESSASELLDAWQTPKVTFPSEPEFRKPRFKDKIHGVVAAAYGLPFWRDGGLWTTDAYANYVEGKLSFDKPVGFSILQGLEEQQKIAKAAAALQQMNIDW